MERHDDDAPVCSACGYPLVEEVWTPDGGHKACPSCSRAHGSEHVLWEPRSFGFSGRRRTPNNVSGIQSWCELCRQSTIPTDGGLRCSEIAAGVVRHQPQS